MWVSISVKRIIVWAPSMDTERVSQNLWMFKQTMEHFDQLNERLCQLGAREDIKIGLAATGHYWKVLWTFLIDHDWTVEVFNPVLSAGLCQGKSTWTPHRCGFDFSDCQSDSRGWLYPFYRERFDGSIEDLMSSTSLYGLPAKRC